MDLERDDVDKSGVRRHGGQRERDECVYRRGGVCEKHGPGAKLYWKPLNKPAPGPGGKMVTRHYYYSCDVGPRGRGRLKQTTLSFRKTTPTRPEDNPRGDNFVDKDDSGRNSICQSSTSKEG